MKQPPLSWKKNLRKALFSLAVTAAVAGGGAASAQTSRLYFAGYLGLNTYRESNFSETTTGVDGDMEFKNAVSLAGALGLRLTPQWRIEAEISRRSADMDRIDYAAGSVKIGGEATNWLYLLNAYYDTNWNWKNLQPFFNVGLGFSSHEVEVDNGAGIVPSATDDAIGFAYALGGGVKYRINPDSALTTSYRYVGTSDMEIDSYDIEYGAHEFRLGLEYDLPVDWLSSD